MRFHLPARDHVVMDWAPALYVIRVDGHLGAIALSAFPGMTPQQKGTHTVLTGWLDQSALYGVLAEMETLGLVLLEVQPDASRANHRNPVMTFTPPAVILGVVTSLRTCTAGRDVPRESREKQ